MLYTEVMANTPKPVRKVAKEASVSHKGILKSQKRKTLSKPATPADKKYSKKSIQRLEATFRNNDREDAASRRGNFEEATNLANRRMTNAGVRLDAYLTPKMNKRTDDAYNPGPKSGFLSKAKKK